MQSVAVSAEFKRHVRRLEAATEVVDFGDARAEPRWFYLLRLRVLLGKGGLLAGELAFFDTGWVSDVLLQGRHLGELTVEDRDVNVLPR